MAVRRRVTCECHVWPRQEGTAERQIASTLPTTTAMHGKYSSVKSFYEIIHHSQVLCRMTVTTRKVSQKLPMTSRRGAQQ